MASRRTPESKPRSKTTASPPVASPPTVPKAAKSPAKVPTPAPVEQVVEAVPAKPVPKKQPVAKRAKTSPERPVVTPDVRRGMIAESAYLRAERRGFAPGHEDEDWMAAEAEVDKLLSADRRAPQ